MPKKKVVPRNVSLYPQDWHDIQRVAQRTGVRSISAALRFILQEWRSRAIIKKQESNHEKFTS